MSSNRHLYNPAHQELEIFSDQTPVQSRAAGDGVFKGPSSQAASQVNNLIPESSLKDQEFYASP